MKEELIKLWNDFLQEKLKDAPEWVWYGSNQDSLNRIAKMVTFQDFMNWLASKK